MQAKIIDPETLKMIGHYAEKAWSALGPLIGVFVGAYLTDRRSKREWLINNKKQEYRELVESITKGMSAYVQIYGQTVRSGDDERLLTATEVNFMEVARSRLFITKQIKTLNVPKRFNDLKRTLENDPRRNTNAFATGIGNLLDEILEEAKADMA